MNHHDVGITDDRVVIAYPNIGIQIFTYLAFSLGLAVNSGIVASRRDHMWFVFTRPRPKKSTWRANLFLMVTFIVSLLFTWSAGFLSFAIGLSRNFVSCRAAILICITAYACTKVITNMFLLERLWIVSGCHRWQNARMWQGGIVAFLLGLPLLGAFFAAFKAELDEGGDMCHIGLHAWGTIGLITWDASLNLYLSMVFALKCRGTALAKKSPLRVLALRTLGVTSISTVTSVVNISVLTGLNFELGSVCLSCCMLDVLVDAFALALLTNSKYESDDARTVRSRTDQTRTVCDTVTVERRDSLANTYIVSSAQLSSGTTIKFGGSGDRSPANGQGTLPPIIELSDSPVAVASAVFKADIKRSEDDEEEELADLEDLRRRDGPETDV